MDHGMKSPYRIIIIFLLFLSWTGIAKEILNITPKLTVNNHQICAQIADAISDDFIDKQPSDRGGDYRTFTEDIGTILTHIPYKAQLSVQGTPVYFHRLKRCPTCSDVLYISNAALPQGEQEFSKILKQEPSLRSLVNGELFQAQTGEYFVLSSTNLSVYKINERGSYTESCHITKKHSFAELEFPESLTLALEAMKLSRNKVAGFQGTCGKSNTNSRWKRDFNTAIDSLPMNPVVTSLKEISKKPTEESYEKDLKALEDWSLTGVLNYQQFHQYLKDYQVLLNELTAHYREKYQWLEDDAKAIAEHSLDTVLEDSIRFYNYNPITHVNEKELRAKILAGNSIENIEFNKDYRNDYGLEEGLLPIAVQNPQAMKHLLSNHVDVNAINAFGKTALMYAAQHNNIASVKLLVQAGANINAETFIPFDPCRYTLTTSGYTALHYAARYASYGVIKYLLESGAAEFATTTNRSKIGNDRFVIDWLDANTKLSADEIKRLKGQLRVPTKSKAIALAHSYMSIAQTKYQQGELDDAYKLLVNSTSLNNKNVDAFLMLAEVANLFGQPRKAIDTATKAYRLAVSGKEKAAALVHIVDAIEYHASLSEKWKSLIVEGQSYSINQIFHFLSKANEYNPSPLTIEKIKSQMNSEHSFVCSADSSVSVFIDGYHRWKKTATGDISNTVNLSSSGKILEICLSNRFSNQLQKKCFSNPDFLKLGEGEMLSSFNLGNMSVDVGSSTFSLKIDGVAECL